VTPPALLLAGPPSASAQAVLDRFEACFPGRRTVELMPERVHMLHDLMAPVPEGLDIRLDPGEFIIDRTLRLPSNIRILGRGPAETTVTLAPHSNCHLFTNADYGRGNRNIFLGNFRVLGNAAAQERPEGHKALTFCCAIYIKTASSVACANLDFFDIRQTCLHFNGSSNIMVLDVAGRRMGWSGVSTSGASNMLVRGEFAEAGLDVIHSAIHLDGGVGVHVEAVVRDTVGNGIMLDSAYAPLRGCSVRGSVERCKRGVSLSGAVAHPLSNVLVQGRFSGNAEAGVMASNADHVAIVDSTITDNAGYGVLFQGRQGGNGCLVAGCEFARNGQDIGYLHASRDNWVFPRAGEAERFIEDVTNARSLRLSAGKEVPWFAGG
jgi:hypothetical protein